MIDESRLVEERVEAVVCERARGWPQRHSDESDRGADVEMEDVLPQMLAIAQEAEHDDRQYELGQQTVIGEDQDQRKSRTCGCPRRERWDVKAKSRIGRAEPAIRFGKSEGDCGILSGSDDVRQRRQQE